MVISIKNSVRELFTVLRRLFLRIREKGVGFVGLFGGTGRGCSGVGELDIGLRSDRVIYFFRIC